MGAGAEEVGGGGDAGAGAEVEDLGELRGFWGGGGRFGKGGEEEGGVGCAGVGLGVGGL